MTLTLAEDKALRLMIQKYWREKSDAQLSKSLEVPVETIQTMREEMGFRRDSLKSFAQRYLLDMPETEKIEFIKRLPADLIWKMAEGNPHSTSDVTSGGEPVKIDISHQLLKVYGNLNVAGAGTAGEVRESTPQLPAGSEGE